MIKFRIIIQGGTGPDIWTRELLITSKTIMSALIIANGELFDDAAIISISQED